MLKVVTDALKRAAPLLWILTICLQLFVFRVHAESIGQVNLAWAANSEPDVAGYIVYFGSTSKNYTDRSVVGNVTKTSISNLTEHQTYYFAISAYNYFGLESQLSKEIVYTIPSVQDAKITMFEGESVDLNLSIADESGNSNFYFIVASVKSGTLFGSGVLRQYIPSPGFIGADQFQYFVYNGVAWSTRRLFTIHVVPKPPPPPLAFSKNIETDSNSGIPITLEGFDSSNRGLKYILLSAPQSGSLFGATPNLTYRPYTDFVGRDSFTFLVSNGFQQSTVATIAIDVVPKPFLGLVQLEEDPLSSGALQSSDLNPVDELVGLADLTDIINSANNIDSSRDPKSEFSFQALESLVELDFTSTCLSLEEFEVQSANQAGLAISQTEANDLIETSSAIQKMIGCEVLSEGHL